MNDRKNVSTTCEKTNEPSYLRFFCGGAAGIASRCLTAPIDRVKVLRQMRVKEIEGLSLLKSWRYIVNEGGMIALWRGNGINVLKNCPESAIRFGFHERLKMLLFPALPDSKRHDLTPLQRLVVAAISGSTSMTCVYPFEVVKTRMTLRKSQDTSSIVHNCMKIYSEGGSKAFYRGYKVAMMSYIPYSSMELSLYELVKRQYMSYFHNFDLKDDGNKGSNLSKEMPHLNWFESCFLTALASLPPMTIVYPLNLLRTRFQASKEESSLGVRQTLKNILRTEGPKGLYKGFFAQISKTLPSVCVSYATLETLLELCGQPTLASR